MKNKDIIILGAGISGLATAFQLQQAGYSVAALEKKSVPGGSMHTEKSDGYLIDYGPNSGLETTPVIRKLVDALGLSDEMIYANEEGNKRYILKNGDLIPLPMNPPQFLKTKLFSTRAKLRLLAEPFIGRSEDGCYQSISEFVTRRLGREFLDYAINPFVAGVYAGNPDKLSVKSAFPKLYALEEKYGGLIKGTIKGAKERKKRGEESKQSAKMFSFKNGMQMFAKALADSLNDVQYDCEVKKVVKTDDGYKVLYDKSGEAKELTVPKILSTVPAYVAAEIFGDIDKELAQHLNEVYYPPVMVLYLGFDKSVVGQNLDGFGFLIPEKEKRSFLGAIWSSVIFKNRAPEGKAAFTLFVGGARSPEIFDSGEDEVYRKVLDEFKSVMKINGEPEFVRKKLWKRAIPQYNLGYIEHEKYFDKFEKENPGIFLGGNYRGGISVGDCMKNSEKMAKIIDNG